MGSGYACEKIETEEEIIHRIMSSMALAEFDTKLIYSEFENCINNNKIDYFLYHPLLKKMVGENNYAEVQTIFFTNLYKLEKNMKNIRKIGLVIIFLSNGSSFVKIEVLCIHFMKYYMQNLKLNQTEFLVRDFINDIIELNTADCLKAIKHLDHIKNISEIWYQSHELKLAEIIFQNFESLQQKFSKRGNKHHTLSVVNFTDENKSALFEKNEKKMPALLHSHSFSDIKENEVIDYNKIINDFIELSYPKLSGEYIRNFIYEEYLKDRGSENLCSD